MNTVALATGVILSWQLAVTDIPTATLAGSSAVDGVRVGGSGFRFVGRSGVQARF